MVVVVAVRARAQWVPSSIAMDPGAASWFCEQQTVQGGASPPATAELQWPLRCSREAMNICKHIGTVLLGPHCINDTLSSISASDPIVKSSWQRRG